MALVEVDLTWPSAAPGFPQSSLLTGRRCLVLGGLLQRELGCEGMDCAIDLVCDILDFLSSWCVPCGDFLTDCVMIAWLSTKETTSLKKTPSTTTSMQTQSISADVCHALHHLPSQNTPPVQMKNTASTVSSFQPSILRLSVTHLQPLVMPMNADTSHS